MKKHVTIPVLLLSAAMMLSVAACVPSGTPSEPIEPDPGPGSSSGSESSGGIPGVGSGEFVPDYDFDYNPHLTIPEASPKETELTIAPEAKVSFVKDGVESKSLTLKVGEKMPEIKNETGLEIAGWYDANNPYRFWSNESFTVPKGGLTIAPYIVMPGTDLNLGNRNEAGRTDIAESTKSASGSYTISYGRAAVGNYLGYQSSFNFTEASLMKFRFITKCTIVGGETNTYHYYFVNYGAEDLTFTPWHINSGYDILEDSVCISGLTEDTPNEITLKPGEGVGFTRQATFTSDNGNTMVLIDFNGKPADGTLGFAFSRATNAEEKFEPVAPILPIENYGEKFTVKLPQGAKFADGSSEKTLKPGSKPAITFTPSAGKTFLGYYEKGNGGVMYPEGAFRMPDRDVELVPYYARSDADMSVVSVDALSAYGNFLTSDGGTTTKNVAGGSLCYGDGEALWYRIDYDFTNPSISPYYRRFSVTLHSETNTKHEYKFYLKNFGSAEAAFNFFAWSNMTKSLANLDPAADETVSRFGSGKTLTLAAGESKEIGFVLTPDENGDFRIVFEFSANVRTGTVGIAACDLGETEKQPTTYQDGDKVEAAWRGNWIASGAETLTATETALVLGEKTLTLINVKENTYTAFAGDTVYTLSFAEAGGVKFLTLTTAKAGDKETNKIYHLEGQELLPEDWTGTWMTFDTAAATHQSLVIADGMATLDGNEITFAGKEGTGYKFLIGETEYLLSYTEENADGHEQLTLKPASGKGLEFVREENAHHYDGVYYDLGNGTHARKCTICEEYEEGAAHVFDKKVKDEDHLAAGKTCLTRDLYYYSCSLCNASSEDSTKVTFEDETGAYAAHTFGDVIAANEKHSYTFNGSITEYDNAMPAHKFCTTCGGMFTEAGERLTTRGTQLASGTVDETYDYEGARTVVFDINNGNLGGANGNNVWFEYNFDPEEVGTTSGQGMTWKDKYARWQIYTFQSNYITFALDYSGLADRSAIAFSVPTIVARQNVGIWVSGNRLDWTLIGYPSGTTKSEQQKMNSLYQRVLDNVRGEAVEDANFHELFYSLADYADLIGESGMLYVRFGYQAEHTGTALGGSNQGATIIDRFTYYDKFTRSTEKFTLTLGVDGAIFADGTKTAKLEGGSVLPAITFTAPEGKQLAGWYAAEGMNYTYYTAGASAMPFKSITIYPYYRRTGTGVYVGRQDNGNSGMVDSTWEPGNMAGLKSYASSEYSAPIVVDGYEGGRLYTVTTMTGAAKDQKPSSLTNDPLDASKNSIPSANNGAWFRFISSYSKEGPNAPQKVLAGKTVKFHFSFENFGDAEIAFKLVMVESGHVIIDASKAHWYQEGETVTLAQKTATSFTFEVTFSANCGTNRNFMPILWLTQDVTNAQLGIAVSYEFAE